MPSSGGSVCFESDLQSCSFGHQYDSQLGAKRTRRGQACGTLLSYHDFQAQEPNFYKIRPTIASRCPFRYLEGSPVYALCVKARLDYSVFTKHVLNVGGYEEWYGEMSTWLQSMLQVAGACEAAEAGSGLDGERVVTAPACSCCEDYGASWLEQQEGGLPEAVSGCIARDRALSLASVKGTPKRLSNSDRLYKRVLEKKTEAYKVEFKADASDLQVWLNPLSAVSPCLLGDDDTDAPFTKSHPPCPPDAARGSGVKSQAKLSHALSSPLLERARPRSIVASSSGSALNGRRASSLSRATQLPSVARPLQVCSESNVQLSTHPSGHTKQVMKRKGSRRMPKFNRRNSLSAVSTTSLC